ncbi:uncharacterized protein BCR38DRAFT_523006 [Pseudomassariella vexata]|uniref:Major facilitator superfamily (MFS) profile domain-containing protein n=1 Tax=Pseudomassariella vexata TaxID=1141098 RepID=A0A1Y2E3N5_9PEZI|nr:uncharacterized protein BCR38DRAFT_523006 [Pseudomassariella vexata]ORY66170.1 hypothetical protein BCR38DRAFT_523006 [Pseudomassariella vexata]
MPRDSEDAEKASSTPEAARCAEEARFSVFTTTEKCLIVVMVSYASWCANTSPFIFLPALKLLAESFSVSVNHINLTVTVYMAVATVAPTLVGDAVDTLGRRPAYIFTLGLFFIANISLAPSEVFRTATWIQIIILIEYGVISDIAPPAERGTFISIISFALEAPGTSASTPVCQTVP